MRPLFVWLILSSTLILVASAADASIVGPLIALSQAKVQIRFDVPDRDTLAIQVVYKDLHSFLAPLLIVFNVSKEPSPKIESDPLGDPLHVPQYTPTALGYLSTLAESITQKQKKEQKCHV